MTEILATPAVLTPPPDSPLAPAIVPTRPDQSATAADRSVWEDVSVSPRYLAGSGYDASIAMAPLTDGAGWRGWTDELANCHITSPCGRAYLGFMPDDDPEALGLWKAWVRPNHHGTRTWIAAFSNEMPYELMTGFTEYWAEGYRPDDETFAHPDNGRRDGVEQVLTVLRHADWDRDHATRKGSNLERWTAPDGRAGVELRINVRGTAEQELLQNEPRWTVWASHAPYRRPLWDAVFSTGTPTGLIAAFCQALADPAPLTREDHQIPFSCRDLVTRT
jgi:hypothetical protein